MKEQTGSSHRSQPTKLNVILGLSFYPVAGLICATICRIGMQGLVATYNLLLWIFVGILIVLSLLCIREIVKVASKNLALAGGAIGRASHIAGNGMAAIVCIWLAITIAGHGMLVSPHVQHAQSQANQTQARRITIGSSNSVSDTRSQLFKFFFDLAYNAGQ